MKVRITRERPGKKIENVRSLNLYDDEDTHMGCISLFPGVVIVNIKESAYLNVSIKHLATEGKWITYRAPPYKSEVQSSASLPSSEEKTT